MNLLKVRDLAVDTENSHTQSLWHSKKTGHVVVSRVIAMDHGGWETMIFSSDSKGNITDYLELYVYRGYESHKKSIENFLRNIGNDT